MKGGDYMGIGLQVITGMLLLSIVVLALRTIEIAIETNKSSKFILKGIMQNEIQRKENDSTFFERIFSLNKYKAYLQDQLEEAHMNITVNRFILKRVIISITIMVLVLSLYSISGQILFLYLTIPSMFMAYKLPKRTIEKHKKYYIHRMKSELPDYLYHFAVLLDSYTPFEATKRSVEYAGVLIKPYVERLITQINLYPTSHHPYIEFAEAVDLREAKEFMVALEQIMKVNAQTSSRIIQDQIQIMTELQEEAYNEQIEERPEEMNKYINAMLFPFVGIILTILFILITSAIAF